MMNDLIRILSRSGDNVVLVVDVLVINVQHEVLLEDLKVGGEPA